MDAYFKIDVDGRRLSVEKGWNQARLQDTLLQKALSLTRVDSAAGQDLSATHSLATSLIQHASGRYSDFSTLDEAWDWLNGVGGFHCNEAEWIRFCLQLENHRKLIEEPLTVRPESADPEEPDAKSKIITDLKPIINCVVKLLDEFQWFRLVTEGPFTAVCLVEDQKIEINESAASRRHYIWYNTAEATFHGITQWAATYRNPQTYRMALMCQIAQSLKDFYLRRLNEGGAGDDELEAQSMIYVRELNKRNDRSVSDHQLLIDGWTEKIALNEEEGIKMLLTELKQLITSENSFDAELELRQQFVESLEKAYEELQIDRQLKYEKSRLEARENREEDERRDRKSKEEMLKVAAEIELLQREIDEHVQLATGSQTAAQIKRIRYRDLWQSARYKVMESTNRKKPLRFVGAAQVIIMQKRELLKNKQEQLEWSRFCVLLSASHPPYAMVDSDEEENDLTATEMVQDTLTKFPGLTEAFKDGQRLADLMSYVRQNSSSVKEELRRLLDKMVTQPIHNNLNGPIWKFDGSALLLSHILKKKIKLRPSATPCEEVVVTATKVIYIDCDWKTPGVSLTLSAPRIETKSKPNRKGEVTLAKRIIDISGEDAEKLTEEKANNGHGPGNDGVDGECGDAGKSAGNVTIQCDVFESKQQLCIYAKGGKGADGQGGGDGQPGIPGRNGKDGRLKPKEDVHQDFDYMPLGLIAFNPIFNLYEGVRSTYRKFKGKEYSTEHLVQGEAGTPGKSGGCGGSAGCGGEGGKGGRVNVHCGKSGRQLIEIVQTENGEDGQDGIPGNGAAGGSGGRNGLDVARVFEPDDLNPWFWISGNWREGKGHLAIKTVYRTSDGMALGSKIEVKDAKDKGRATDGEQGENGEKAQLNNKKTSAPKRSTADVAADWRGDAVNASSEVNERIRKTEEAVQRLNRLMTDSDQTQRRIRDAAKQEETSEKELREAKEREQRMREVFRNAKMQSSSQLTQRTTERTQSIATHQPNYEDHTPTSVTTAASPVENRPPSTELHLLEGVSLLDALIIKFSGNVQLSSVMSTVTQSLVLQIFYPVQSTEYLDLWTSITKLVRQNVDRPPDLIDILQRISQNIELIQLLVSEKKLLNDMRDKVVQKKQVNTELDDNVSIIYYFGRLSWTYEELQSLLKPLEQQLQNQSNHAVTKLTQFLGEKLISVVANMMTLLIAVDKDEEDKQDAIKLQQTQLKEIYQFCSVTPPSSSTAAGRFSLSKKSTVVSTNKPLAIGPFFDKLVSKLKPSLKDMNKNKTPEQVEKAFSEFVCSQLNVKELKELASQPDSWNKLSFLLDRVKIDIKEMDSICRRLEKQELNDLVLLEKTEQSFVKFHWKKEWGYIFTQLDKVKREMMLKEELQFHQELEEKWKDLQVSVNGLRKALTWTLCGKTFQQRMNICSELQKKINKSENFFNKMQKKEELTAANQLLQWTQWVKEQDTQIVGYFEKNSASDSRTSFITFIHRLLQYQQNEAAEEKDAMKLQIRRALHYLDHNRHEFSLTALEISLMNDALDKRRFQGDDDALLRDMVELRSQHLRHWPKYYFLPWINCYEEVDRLRKTVRYNWKEECINAASNSVAEPTKVIRRMDLLLNRYALLTTVFLSPVEGLKKWKSLQQEPPFTLEQAIRSSAVKDFPAIEKIMTDIEASIPGSDKTSEDLLDRCLSAANSLVSQNQEDSIQFLADIELLLECWIEQTEAVEDRTERVSLQIDSWNVVIQKQVDVNQSKVASLSKVVNILAMSIMGSTDDYIYSHLERKIKFYRNEMERALRSLETFFGYISGDQLQDPLDVVKASVMSLKDGQEISPSSLNSHRNRLQRRLVEKKVDIWRRCHSNISPKKDDAQTFFETLLSSSSTATFNSRLAIADQLLVDHLNTPDDVASLKQWANSVAKLANSDDTKEQLVVAIQSSLIGHFGVFNSRQSIRHKESNRQSINFHIQEAVNQLITLTRFLAKSQVEINQLLIGGLLHLAQALDECATESRRLIASDFLSDHVHYLLEDKKSDVYKQNVKKKDLLYALYNVPGGDGHLFSPLEKTSLERCLKSQSFSSDGKKVVALFNVVQTIKKSRKAFEKSTENRLVSAVGLDDMLTKEEKRYVTITGREEAEKVFQHQHPAAYLAVFKERAVQLIYEKMIRHFYPENDTELTDVLFTFRYRQEQENQLSEKKRQVVDFQKSFERGYFFARRDNVEFEWLLWLQETVLKSLASSSKKEGVVSLKTVADLISTAAEFSLDELFISTATSRPYRWIDDVLISCITKAVAQLPTKSKKSAEQQKWNLTSDLELCLASKNLNGRSILEILSRKVEQETRLVAAAEPVDSNFIASLVNDLKLLQSKIEDLDRFRHTPIGQWPTLIRHAKLAEVWPDGLTNQLVAILDRRLGVEKTDRFLARFIAKYRHDPSTICQILEGVLKNLAKYPWIIDHFATLGREEDDEDIEDDDRLWKLIQSAELIAEERAKASESNLEAREILKMMRNDPQSKSIVGSKDRYDFLICQVETIKLKASNMPIKTWTLDREIKNWTKEKKESRERVDPIEFLSVASQVVRLKMNCQLRDSQILAVLVFVSSLSDENPRHNQRRMAQISTGEGKTLITALLVVYHVLDNWSNGRRSVDIITSSSVLAEANVAEMKWFYEAFGVGVENNCDAACSEDEKVRSLRYNTDVVYGDLSSFQRDILLSRFISERDITRNRNAGALVVDEVDSMLLDKGENILYLSHKIPEMEDLMAVFVEIWAVVHDDEVALGDETSQANVYRYIKSRLEEGTIVVPKCLQDFALRHLLAWIRNAFRAKDLVTTKDTYKVEDLGDGRGQQIVIMDKETGVEQVQMQWSHGLHQFLQLKHNLKLSPVSLKAVFMSNVGFFEQRKDTALYGMTGTLGSTAECQLLHEVFQVDFFKMPRFRRRFCLEVEHLLAPTRSQWLDNVVQATKNQVEAGQAVLVVCENIKAADSVYSKLASKLKCKITKYVSSFDKDFQEKQHSYYLAPGDVIVATNLAGRGTDLKISQELAKKGGLHVIIGYMPANARVEAQIEGRVARAGQPGSFQFVVWHPSVSVRESDVASELSRLKMRRDDRECRRLEQIRTKGLQKIALEEKLFDRFHKEIYGPVKKTLVKQSPTNAELLLQFLTNRWALWLDENGQLIDNVHVNKTIDTVENNFSKFKDKCLSLGDPIQYASTPTELLQLAEFFESNNTKENASENANKSRRCCDQIVKDDPKLCHIALLRQAKLVLQAADGTKKQEARQLLIRAQTVIKQKCEQLRAISDLIKKTSKANQKSGDVSFGENRFEEQIVNTQSLLQVHIAAIDDLLGRTVRQSLNTFFKEEEVKQLMDVIGNDSSLCKPFRLSKKVSVQPETKGSDDDGLWMNQAAIDWPSILMHCKNQTIQLVKTKTDALRKSFTKDVLTQAVVSQDQLWQGLIDEGLVGDEQVTDKDIIRWKDKEIDTDEAVKVFLNELPESLADLKLSVFVAWLNRHDGEELTEAAAALSLSIDQLTPLKEFLVKKKILVHLNEKNGKLLKPMTFRLSSSFVDLPENLKKFDHLLAAWIMQDFDYKEGDETVAKAAGEPISREQLPCPKDIIEGVDQLWTHLLNEGVIKDPKMLFCSADLSATKSDIQECCDKIREAVKSKDKIKSICSEFRPTDAVTEVSYKDLPGYLAGNPKAAACYVKDTIFQLGSDNKLMEVFKQEKENVKRWLTEQRKNEDLESYQSEVANALINSFGQLRTIPLIDASFHPLSDYFKSDQSASYPVDEIQSLADKTFDRVIKVKSHATWWDYWDRRAFYVLLAGVAQIAIGVAITALSGGALGFVGNAFMAEGVSDMIFAIQSSVTGTFSWQSYRSHKKWSLAMTVATAGLGAYLTKGAAAGRAAAFGFQGKAGLALLWAASRKVLAKCGQAILSVATSMGAEKLIQWLKTFLIEKVLKHIKFLISKALFWIFNAITKALDQIWTAMKKLGLRVEDVIRTIDGSLDKAKTSDLFTLWGRRMTSQAASVGSAVGRCFAESRDVLSGDGQHKLNVEENAAGLDVLKKSFRYVRYAEKAMKIVKWLKNGSEIVSLITFAPEYANNVEKVLAAEARKLEERADKTAVQQQSDKLEIEEDEDEVTVHEETNENQQSSKMTNVASETKSETQVFNEYKEKVRERIEGDVVNYMVDSVTKTWVQPWLQGKIENMIVTAGKKTFECLGSMWQGEKGSASARDQTGEKESGNEAENAQKAEAEEKKIGELLGEDNCEKQKDSNGNIVVQPKNYKDVVESLGQGKTAGLLEMQMVADATNCTIEIIDETGDNDFKSENGSFEVTPDGKSTGKIQMIYTKNPDGSKHVALRGPDGKPMEMPSNGPDGQPVPPNRCLYEAVAQATNCPVDKLLGDVKAHAMNNQQAQYLYAEKLDEALPNLRVGRRPDPQALPAEISFLLGVNGEVTDVMATLTPANIKGGSNVTGSAYKDLKEAPADEEVGETQAGHLVAFDIGGKGGKKENNIVNMAAALNQGHYKHAEMLLAKSLKGNAKVYLHIRLNEGVDGPIDFRNPVSFRYSFMAVNDEGKTTTFYDSGTLKNTNDYDKEEYKRNEVFIKYPTDGSSAVQPESFRVPIYTQVSSRTDNKGTEYKNFKIFSSPTNAETDESKKPIRSNQFKPVTPSKASTPANTSSEVQQIKQRKDAN